MKITNVTKENIDLFKNIAIETSARCNRHCHFCPNDFFKRPDELMSWDMIEHIAVQLGKMKYNGRIEFYIYNEPTKDQRLMEIIRLFRLQVPRACLMISTNGDYLKTKEDILAYLNAGLNQFLVNIYSASDKSKDDKVFNSGVLKAGQRYATISKWIEELGFPSSPLYHKVSTKAKIVKIKNKYGVRNGNIEGTDFDHLSNRSGLSGEATKEPLKKHCTKPFRFLNINWKGDSLLCCNDYHGETNFGNVMQKTLIEIWNHPKFHEYRLHLQNKDRSLPLCNTCDSNGGYYPHMINAVTFGKAEDKKLLNG